MLIATDVAARGLDLPEVGLIIHYNLPQNIENYIHRSGRTARIHKKGISIAFAGPGETKSLLEIEKLLNKKITRYQVELSMLEKSKEIVRLASEISMNESENVGKSKFSSWNIKASEEIGIESSEKEAKIAPKKIRNLKKMLEKAKYSIELPRKRNSVITPELFELAKKHKLV